LLVGFALILHGAPPLPVLLGIAAAGLVSFFRRKRTKTV
jgi:LPXTG-motif cell wall-anchored protein